MASPLFGYSPKESSPSEVYEDCVQDFDASTNRPCIWDGILQIVEKTKQVQDVDGVLHIDSEFVELIKEPSQAALVLETNSPVSRALLDLWGTDNGKEFLVQTYLLPPRPDTCQDDIDDWEATKSELIAQLTDHGRKGYPIVKFLACHAYTK